MQNNRLEHYDLDLEQADNKLIQYLRNSNWVMEVKADDNLESQDALAFDMARAQFLVKGEKFMDFLQTVLSNETDSKQEKTGPTEALITHLTTIYPELETPRIVEDVSNLNKSWNQDIGGLILKAINDTLQANPNTAHLFLKCDYTTNLTYENGKMVLDVNYSNLQLFNTQSYQSIPLPSKSIAARWELNEGSLKLRKIEGNDKELITLTEHASVPPDSVLFTEPKFFSKDAATAYLNAKQEQIEKLWNVTPDANLNHLPPGVKSIYQKCLNATKSNIDVIKLATDVKKIWDDKWKQREQQTHTFLGKFAQTFNAHRDKKSEEFYQHQPSTPTKKIR